MSLSGEEKKALVDYRLEKAFATLDEAKKIFDIHLYNLTANRLYYAVYYAATALLLNKDLSSHTHRGSMTLFHLHFVKTNILSVNDGSLFRQLFGMRHEGDYEDFIDFEKEDVEPIFPLVQNFLEKIQALISSKEEISSEKF